MLGQELTIKTPGKLMVAGEFAVLEKGYPLLVMAVDRYVYTTIRDSEENKFTSENFGLHNLTWKYDGYRVVFDDYSPRLKFVTSALTTVLSFLKERGVETTPFSMSVRSELDDEETGAKYGLGSSAAVVTSVVTAVLEKFLRYRPARSLIFKLASIAHVRTQGSGSGADIAASTYGGVLHYKSFQASWLKKEMNKTKRILPILQKNWPYLHIEQIYFPENIYVCIGWTGNPASTKNLVSEITKLKRDKQDVYSRFLKDSRQAVQQILTSIEENDIPLFLEGITKNRQALARLGELAQVPIETEKLAQLSNLAEQLDGAGKLSGAGGGDCGLAFLTSEAACTTIQKKWETYHIQPLALKVDPEGTVLM